MTRRLYVSALVVGCLVGLGAEALVSATLPCSWYPRELGPMWWHAPERCFADGGGR